MLKIFEVEYNLKKNLLVAQLIKVLYVSLPQECEISVHRQHHQSPGIHSD